MPSDLVWKLGRRAELDGLRAIAILLVVICHMGVPHLTAAGQVGVTMFFTLSGFLITSLLLDEWQRRRGIDLRAFYWRRALRLLPALVVMLVLLSFLLIVTGDPAVGVLSDAAAALFYFGNWVRMTGHYLGSWSHTWSLAIEEQFYLVWPLVFIAVAKLGRKAILALALAGTAYSIVARFALWDGGDGLSRVYYGTDMHADALLIGAGLAAWMHGRRDGRSFPLPALGFTLGAAAWGLSGHGFANFVLGMTFVPVLTAGAIFCVSRGAGARWLAWHPLVYVGRRSYGLYLWHYPLLAMGMSRVPGPPLLAAALLVGVSWIVTLLSWSLVEQRFLRLKDRGRGGPAAAQGVASETNVVGTAEPMAPRV